MLQAEYDKKWGSQPDLEGLLAKVLLEERVKHK